MGPTSSPRLPLPEFAALEPVGRSVGPIVKLAYQQHARRSIAHVPVGATSQFQRLLPTLEKLDYPTKANRNVVAHVHVGFKSPPHQSLPELEEPENQQKTSRSVAVRVHGGTKLTTTTTSFNIGGVKASTKCSSVCRCTLSYDQSPSILEEPECSHATHVFLWDPNRQFDGFFQHFQPWHIHRQLLHSFVWGPSRLSLSTSERLAPPHYATLGVVGI